MELSIPPIATCSLDSMPCDVLSHIALETVSIPCGIPTPRELTTVRSLVLTGRKIHESLSPSHNPHLYANIFRLMFDVKAARRRMGADAVVASASALELQKRVEALKRIKSGLDAAECNEDIRHALSTDLVRAFMMMTEDDGKNRHQLIEFVDVTRIPTIFASHASRNGPIPKDHARNAGLSLIIALMWMTSNDVLPNEDPIRRVEILDLLEPLVAGTSSLSHAASSYYRALQDCGSIVNIEYFGLRCRFSLPSITPFARLCTVGRYNAFNRRHSNGSDDTCIPASSNFSARFDDEWWRYLTVEPAPLLDDNNNTTTTTTTSHEYSSGTFEGLWEGTWFIPRPIDGMCAIVMCARPMQCRLREYASFSAETSVSLIDGEEPDNGSALSQTWFPEGVDFDETATSLKIYDPTKDQWLHYSPRSEMPESLDNMDELPLPSDTVLIGNTEGAHGARHGEYTFYGRVGRRDGTVTLCRKPADHERDELGTWIFHGQVHGGVEFVGDWRVASTQNHPLPGQGWFHMSKIASVSED